MHRASPDVLNCLTVDVEDYFQVSAFAGYINRSQWDQWETRVVANTHRILKLLDQCELKATFFVLGWVGHKYPGLVRDICDCGHEIGSHSYWHRLIYELSPEEFRSDLRLSRDVLENASGRPVVAYRAPSFSITRRSLWALDILAEEGFLIDSSVFPIHHDRYGIPGAEPRIHRIATSAGPLWEFPPAAARLVGLNIPVGGGGYFRLYPFSWTCFFLRRINRTGEPFIFYVHPWELDPGQPRIPLKSRISRFRHYVNLARNERKLQLLLWQFRFGRLRDVINSLAPERGLELVGGGAVRQERNGRNDR
jgi:polysaccharide deacetylase family protein (PEP-CTERM system associated)